MKREDYTIYPCKVRFHWTYRIHKFLEPVKDFLFGEKCGVCGKKKVNMTCSAYHDKICLSCLSKMMGYQSR